MEITFCCSTMSTDEASTTADRLYGYVRAGGDVKQIHINYFVRALTQRGFETKGTIARSEHVNVQCISYSVV